ncbi:type II toxin-antitoxin system RelE/ParE family toxin [Roseateles sp. LYH14W]|uniref:Type II toxin-antitoxin system RelE/ParE family toxin n=1 Tax=Pelomonas parva TaxID=3299032 RepID=A0ABW7F572_9BURK
MSYVLSPEAEGELSDAASFCRTHFGPVAAESFLATFESKVRLIADFPGVGTATSKGRRLYPIGRYPFSILYRTEAGVVRISAIAHHGRRPAYWQGRP